jgi:hypothetical protein
VTHLSAVNVEEQVSLFVQRQAYTTAISHVTQC